MSEAEALDALLLVAVVSFVGGMFGALPLRSTILAEREIE